AGERANLGPTAPTAPRPRGGSVAHAPGDHIAATDSDPWEPVGGRPSGVAGGRYGGAVWGQCGRGICVDGRWGRLRHDLGGSASDVGTRPGWDLGGPAGYRGQSALLPVGFGQ